MATKKVPIKWFLDQIIASEKRHDGYIMGSTGQNPKNWKTSSWWFTQYKGSQLTKALYWRDHASRVWDCNGMAEGFYKDYTGTSINTYARVNFHEWCASDNGWGVIPKSRAVPGMAVFKANTYGSWSSIHHVGYIVSVSGDTATVIEAKGVMYGVIRSTFKLTGGKSSNGWNAWGKMDKYFDYESTSSGVVTTESTGTVSVKNYPELSKGDSGDYVELVQKALKAYNSSYLPKYGTDRDFGDETREYVKKFQKAHNLEVDGVVGNKTWAELLKYLGGKVQVTGSSVNIRSGAGTEHNVVAVAHAGDKFDFTERAQVGERTWYHTSGGWISGKYAEEV